MSKPSEAALKAARLAMRDLEPHINHVKCACETPKECYFARKQLLADRIDAAADEKYAGPLKLLADIPQSVAPKEKGELSSDALWRFESWMSGYISWQKALRDALRKIKGEG